MSTPQERLAQALAEEVVREDQEGGQDPENRKFLLHDLNSLLAEVGAENAEIKPEQLDNPAHLQAYLAASLDPPVQNLQKALPNRLAEWAKQPPPRDQLSRMEWASKGRWLLSQAALNPEQD
jgi:hypothetical protein